MVAVLVWDAADVALLERMLDEGRLPAVAELRRRGRWRRLETPGKSFSASAFQTLYNGTHLSEHGLYFTYQWSAADQRLRHLEDFTAPENVWERLAGAGRRSLVVDPYEARPPDAANGVYLGGWQFRNRASLTGFFAPGGVDRRLGRRFGRPRLLDEVFGHPSLPYLLRMRRGLLEAPGRAADAVTELLPREEFDLVWVVFPSIHLGGHWLRDPLARLAAVGDGQKVDPEARRQLETGLSDVYAATDAAVARILEALPPGAEVIVTSSVGMGDDPSRLDLLPGMLERVLAGGGARPGRRAAGSWIWRLRGTVGSRLRGGVAQYLPDRLVRDATARLELRGIDWSRTRAFPVPSDKNGYVRLNLRGREREGIVDQNEAGALMDEIAEGLMTFTDPDGTPPVASVERATDLMSAGAGVDRVPDLVVNWSDRSAWHVGSVSSPLHGEVHRKGRGTGRNGGHDAAAFALVAPSASSVRETSRPPHVVDVAATVCALLGVDEAGLSGEPLLQPHGP